MGSRGLLDIREGETEYLAAYDGGNELWRHSITELFGTGYSSDQGWSFEYDERSDLYVGGVGFTPTEEGGRTIVDLAESKLVAIERATGEVVWSEDGVADQCDGTVDIITDEELTEQAAGENVFFHPIPVRCRVQGTVTYTESDDPEAEPERTGIDVTLEGYDPETGETTWSVALGEALNLLGYGGSGDPLPFVDRTGVAVTVDGEPTAVDIASGQTRAVGADETLWCADRDSRYFDYREPYYFDGEPTYGRVGELAYDWCEATGQPAAETATPPTAVPNTVGTRSGDLAMVATPEGLVAYR